MQRIQTFAATATLGFALAACGGGTSGASLGSPVPAAPAVPAGVAGITNAARIAPDAGTGGAAGAATIASVDGFGAVLKILADENAEESTGRTAAGTGACNRGVEFFVPDKAGDADSSELVFFYDRGCTHVARDSVRIYAMNETGSETVSLTVKTYGLNSATPASVRTTTAQIANATFTANGYPEASTGFTREASSQLTVGNDRKIVLANSEFVIEPSASGTNAYCGDAAAFNAAGVGALERSFGWSGILSNGSRVQNGSGSVTWSGMHAGTLVQGAPGSLSLTTGTPNSACPIATPDYSIAGGSKVGSASTTFSVTYDRGAISNLDIAGASLSGGYTINVATNPKAWPTAPNYITGAIVHRGKSIATLAVNTFGDGTLTLENAHVTLLVIDWIVVR